MAGRQMRRLGQGASALRAGRTHSVGGVRGRAHQLHSVRRALHGFHCLSPPAISGCEMIAVRSACHICYRQFRFGKIVCRMLSMLAASRDGLGNAFSHEVALRLSMNHDPRGPAARGSLHRGHERSGHCIDGAHPQGQSLLGRVQRHVSPGARPPCNRTCGLPALGGANLAKST
jgi:hypothetical protein